MLEVAAFHSFLLYFFKMFNYILLFLPQTDDAAPEKNSVLSTKRKFFFGSDLAQLDAFAQTEAMT